MKFFKMFALVSTLIFGSTAFADRYVIQSKYDLSSVKNDRLLYFFLNQYQFKNLNGFVVDIPPALASIIQKRFPWIQITKDAVASLPKTSGASKVTQPAQVTPWGVADIDADIAHSYGFTGAGVKVCILDTGVNANHLDLKANILGGYSFVTPGKTTSWADDQGHGTHVAGTIAAVRNTIGVVGVAPSAKIYAIKVLNSAGTGYYSWIADGVLEAIRQGCQVINMSLGSKGDPNADSPFRQAVQSAVSKGIIVVVAAGNEATAISGYIPAGFPGVIAVAASDINHNIASFSNNGLSLKDVTAPGVNVYSTDMNGGYSYKSGTSMASPHVAGVAALRISARKTKMITNDIGYSSFFEGSGLIDALKTVQQP
jgi:subtilisin